MPRSLPRMASDFDVSLADMNLGITAYLLGIAVLGLLGLVDVLRLPSNAGESVLKKS